MSLISKDRAIGNLAERENLKMVLSRYGIATDNFGKGDAKTLDDLFSEIQEGETTLVEHEGNLLRVVRFAGVDVFYKDGNHEWELYEDRQEFADGRVRRRSVGFSMSEKLTARQKPEDAAKEGVKKELGIEDKVDLKKKGKKEEHLTSPSYPGLQSKYAITTFVANLKPNQFKPEGYIEVQPGKKTTYFLWRQIK